MLKTEVHDGGLLPLWKAIVPRNWAGSRKPGEGLIFVRDGTLRTNFEKTAIAPELEGDKTWVPKERLETVATKLAETRQRIAHVAAEARERAHKQATELAEAQAQVRSLQAENRSLQAENRRLRRELWFAQEKAPPYNYGDDSMPWGFSQS